MNLKISAGPNNFMVPYKVDMGTGGNIIPLHIHKTLFSNINNEQLAAIKNNNIQLPMCNKTAITQLGICIIELEHKNNKRKCRFFVVPGKGQALLGIPDIDVLNIIKINIHAIGVEQTIGSDNCCANM